ncbi:MAG: hypothetical protein WCK58_18370 [Chloroflexota bacterium]
MHADSILIAIDEALGAPATCQCNRELFPAERDGALYLECPSFSETSWLPARIAFFLDGAFHDQYLVDRLPAASAHATVAPAPMHGGSNVTAGPVAA